MGDGDLHKHGSIEPRYLRLADARHVPSSAHRHPCYLPRFARFAFPFHPSIQFQLIGTTPGDEHLAFRGPEVGVALATVQMDPAL